jgi:predicted nucleic acid-binding protein
MPVLDTEVLFALDPKDVHHKGAVRILSSKTDLVVPDTSLFEYLTVLRTMNVKASDVKQLFLALAQDLSRRGVTQAKTIDALLLTKHSELESDSNLTFFDSLIAASALSLDQAIVSDDKDFDRVPGLKRIQLS